MNELLQANVFAGMPPWEAIICHSASASKVLRFDVQEEEKMRPLYLAAVISRDEKMAWQSFQDLLDHTITLAEAGVQGIFGLDVLTVDIQTGIRYFNVQDFSRLIINHSRQFVSGPKVLIRYGQLFALFHKRASADWGKIELKTHVEIVDPEKIRLKSYFKKIYRQGRQEPDAFYLFHDMSIKPVFNTAEPVPGKLYLFHASRMAAQPMFAEPDKNF
ncbi:MAG TPA: hypothetical protein PLO78_00010 [Candidatus Omnitrophota bacterium]|nr:hypothetical protein [Candidatus Omnitrophota bacterium]